MSLTDAPSASDVQAPATPAPKLNADDRALARRSALLLVIVLAAFLRVHHIGAQSLWADEGLTNRILQLPATEMLQHIRDWEQTPPVYYYLIKPWVLIFGNSETALRFPSAIFGTLSVLALYLAVRRIFGTAAALVAALLLALSPYHIAYSQEARAYALLVLLTIVSCDLFMRLLQKRTNRLEGLYVLVASLLIYTHLYGIFVLAAQNIAYGVAWLFDRRAGSPHFLPLKRFLMLDVAIAIIYSAFVPTVLTWMRSVEVTFWVKSVTLDDISQAYQSYAGSTPMLLALVILAVIGVWRARDRIGAILWLGVMLLPVVVPVIISVLSHPSFSARYGICASLGLFALAAAGVSVLPSLRYQLPVALVLAVISLLPTNTPDLKPQWQEAARFLEKNMHPGDYAAVNRKGATCMYDYYVHRPDVRRIGFDGMALPVSQPLRDYKHIWLILYTCDTPADVMLRRGHWCVGKQRAFRDIFIAELFDPPTTQPTE